MKPLRFYEHFACAYGTLFLLTLIFSLLTESYINGTFGLIGFPIIALLYAIVRSAANPSSKIIGRDYTHSELDRLRAEVAELRRQIDGQQRR